MSRKSSGEVSRETKESAVNKKYDKSWEQLGISDDFIFGKVMQNTVYNIEKGNAYSSLSNSYIIFICKFDLFKQGRLLYI